MELGSRAQPGSVLALLTFDSLLLMANIYQQCLCTIDDHR